MIKKYKYEILIFLFAVLVRIPYLGHDSFNTDVWRWKTRTYNFSNGVFSGDFGLTLQKYHPGVSLMWLGSAGIKIYNLYYDVMFGGEPAADNLNTVFGLNAAQKYFVVVAVSFAIAFAFYALHRLFGTKFAALSILFVFMEPFYLGLSREFHLEGLMSTFMLASVLLAFYFFRQHSVSRWILTFSAWFAGIAILTKITAVFVIPFIVGSYFAFAYLKEKNIRQAIQDIWVNSLIWLGVLLLTFFVMWPALWVRPADVFTELYRGIFDVGVEGGHAQFYFGKFVTDPGFSFYFVSLFYRSSIFFVPGIFGYFLWARKKANKEVKAYVLYLLVFSVFYMLPLLISSKKLDRYMLPALMSLSLVSSAFYYYLMRSTPWSKYFIGFAVALWTGYLAFLTPDYLSYYSPYGGGASKGIYVIEPKWVIGARSVQDYLRQDIEKNGFMLFIDEVPFRKIKRKDVFMDTRLVVALPEKYFSQLYPFVMETGAWPVLEALHDDARYADYFIFPVWEDNSAKVNKFTLNYAGSIYMPGAFRDTKVFNVYKNMDN